MTKRKPNKIVYHIGDTIRIINPRFVHRVGYPLVYTDLIKEFENHPNLHQCLVLLGLANEHEQISPRSRLARDFIVGCAKAAVRHRGFGGLERKIYYKPDLPYYFQSICEIEDSEPETEVVAKVVGKRVVKTGTYYPPYSGYNYEGEYDYEPGGLSNEKTHILLDTIFGEIEETDVELVKRGS